MTHKKKTRQHMARTLIIACKDCGRKSPPIKPRSPAAPMLTALEDLHREFGWAYKVGFFTMMTGDYHPLCPSCAKSNCASNHTEESNV